MKKIFNKYTITALIILITSMIGFITLHAETTYQDLIDEITNAKKETVYNLKLNAPFSKDKSGVREVVNPETGDLSVFYDLFKLNGRGGVNAIDLSLVYRNNSANVKEENAQYNTSTSKYENTLVDKTAFEKAQSYFGAGWNFYFPYVEKQDAQYNKTETYVHLPDGTVYKKDTSAKGLLDYKLDNLTFNSDAVTRNGVDCSYRLIYLDGTIYYFNSDGYLVEKSDRFNNSVFYEWMDKDGIKVIKNITDNCGHRILFGYDNNTIEIKYEGKTYKISRTAIDGETGAYYVSEIVDPAGRKTSFEYFPKDIQFNFLNNTTVATPITNKYYLMSQITYPTGIKTKYEYTTGRKWLYEKENGYIDYTKIYKRYDTDNITQASELKYYYTKEPDGYPDYKSTSIPEKYMYSTMEVDTTGAKTYYVYNNKHDQFKTEKWSPTRLIATEAKDFDERTRMPIRFINDTYNEDGRKLTIYADTAFDSRGNVTEQDKYSLSEGKGKHNHSYKYSVGYNLCIYESYKKDENTKIEITRELDSQGRAVAAESIKENGRLVRRDTYTYDEYGNRTQEKLQLQENEYAVTNYVYGSQYNMLYPTEVINKGVKNADGEGEDIKTKLEYDKYGNVTRKTDNEGYSVKYTYDLLDRKTKETLEDNRSRELKYNDKDNKIQTTDAQGARFLYNYDQYGKLVSVIDMITSVTMLQREYDSKERLIKETDANGTVKELKYDCIDRITSVSYTQADGRIITANQLEYDEAYNSFDETYMKLTVRGGDIFDQRETYYLFDYNSRQVEKTIVGEKENHTMRYLYDYAGNNTVVIDPAGNETKLEYDCFGNPIRVIKPDGTEESSEYNFMGKQISATNGEYETFYTYYDSLGRKIKQEIPYTSKDKYNAFKTYYDSRNNVVKEIDAKGNKKEYGYNERGFLTSASLYNDAVNGIVTNYDYDGEGRITKLSYGGIENADERKTFTNTLDHLGRVTVRTDSLGYKQYYKYDNNGNVIKYTNRNGITTSYQYDGLNRKVQETNEKEGQTEYGYNDFNQLTYMSNGTQKTEYKYNKAGNLSKIIKDWTTESFEYDIRGNVTKRTTTDKDIGDIALGYEYNKLGQLTSVATPIGTEKLYYDKAGRINYKENTQTGINKSYTYYPQGTVRNIMTRRDDNLVYSEYYEYDANGNKTYSDENGSVNEYSYDGMGRLKTVVENDTKQTEYEFDDYNNIKKEYELVGSDINTRSFYYDANNRLILSENKYTIEQYEYDNEGNMIQKKEGMGSNISTSYYQYDGYNRLNGFISDNTTAEYKYNLEGLRESKTVNDVKTRLVYNDANIVGEYTNGEYYKYYRGSELIGYENDQNQNYYFRQNSHGDVTALLDYAGNVIEDYTYNAYGKERQISINPQGDKTILYQWQKETDTTHNPFRYCGEFCDEETGNIYLRARYYDPDVGRFISEDPIKSGQNWYTYCRNNPVNFGDPSGLDEEGTGDERFDGTVKGLMLKQLKQAWGMATTDKARTAIHIEAENLRGFDDNNFKAAIFINGSNNAYGLGHNGILLLNSKGEALFLSYYPKNPSAVKSLIGQEGTMRFAVLNVNEVNQVLYGNGEVTAIDNIGRIRTEAGNEAYDRSIYIEISNGQGYNIYNKAVNIFTSPGKFSVAKQCDIVANQMLDAGGVGYTVGDSPNTSFWGYAYNKNRLAYFRTEGLYKRAYFLDNYLGWENAE